MDEKLMTLPVIALRGLTVLPEMIQHFDISRDKSISAVEHAMAGAGECAQRITDLPTPKDMVEKVMGDAEAIIRGLAAKYVAD